MLDFFTDKATMGQVSLPASTILLMLYRGADKSLARADLKKQLKCRHFSSDAEVIATAETWLDGDISLSLSLSL